MLGDHESEKESFMLNRVFLVLVLLTFSQEVLGKTPETFLWIDNPVKAGPIQNVVETKLEGHVAKVVAKYKPFDPKRHGLNLPPGSIYKNKYPSKDFLGTDGEVPGREFDFMKVYLDGQEIPIPKKYYEDCFEPNLNPDLFQVRIGDDLKSVFVFMSGSTAAGHYDVIWVFQKNGAHSRYVSRVSDMSLWNLDKDNGEQRYILPLP